MKTRISFVAILLFLTVSGIAAQDQPPPDAARPDAATQPGPGRPNLLSELGLSRDQMQRLSRMNRDRKPKMEAAQKALRDAMTALDAAIYADSPSEATVAARLTDFQAAQAEISRIRFSSEFAVRQILTPDQLVKFRDLRRRFEEERDKMRDERRKGKAFRRCRG